MLKKIGVVFGGIIAVILFIVIIAGTGLGIKYYTAPINAEIERNVMVNSHQYIEGRNDRVKILRANYESVSAMLITDPTNQDMLAQKRALAALIKATY